MFKRFLDMLRGFHTPPVVVATLRGLLEAAVLGGLAALAEYVSNGAIPVQYAYLTPAAMLLIRIAEGTADHIDPVKQRRRVVADTIVGSELKKEIN